MKKTAHLLVLALLASSLALAGSADAPASSSSSAVGVMLLNALMPVILTAGSTALTAALGYAANYFKGRAKLTRNERTAKALTLITDLVFEKVGQLVQESTATLKAASADGSLRPDEAKAAFTKAVSGVWMGVPEDLKKLLIEIAGSEQAALDTYVRPKIETAVRSQNDRAKFTAPRQVSKTDVDAARASLGLSPL